MKKQLIIAAFTLLWLSVNAQNVQVHYDFGRSIYNLNERPTVTTTFEFLKVDKLGNTFMFTDFDYYKDGVAGAYWEISREFNVSKDQKWAVHLEYDGGLTSSKITHNATRFQHAVLVGGAFNTTNVDFSKTMSLQLMYKYNFKGQHEYVKPYSSVQLTSVWNINFAKNALSFGGFADIWYDPNVNGKIVFMSEPQLWFNFNSIEKMKDINLSVGTEVEITNNFIYDNEGNNNKAYFIPTIAAKYTF